MTPLRRLPLHLKNKNAMVAEIFLYQADGGRAQLHPVVHHDV
jgi:hypothetical protein